MDFFELEGTEIYSGDVDPLLFNFEYSDGSTDQLSMACVELQKGRRACPVPMQLQAG